MKVEFDYPLTVPSDGDASAHGGAVVVGRSNLIPSLVLRPGALTQADESASGPTG